MGAVLQGFKILANYATYISIYLHEIQLEGKKKLDILTKLDVNPTHQGSCTDQVETWTELSLRGLECRLPNSIVRCTNLKTLNISLIDLDDEENIITVFELEALEELDLSQCSITTIPPQITVPKKLKKLNLSENELTEIPLPLCNLLTLEELDVNGNEIKTIRPEIKRLWKLTKINISSNPLEEFPLTILQLKRLENLRLASTSITTIPHQIQQLSNLKELDLSGNGLEEFQPKLFKRVTLEVLNLSETKLAEVPLHITQLKNLKELNISENHIEELSISVCKLVTLETLDLKNTGITTVPPQITQLRNLKRLKLHGNQLEEFPLSVCKLVSLETLDLEKTNIPTVPPQITQLKNLKALHLGQNQLEEFPLSVCELVTLETLEILGNNITSVPHQIEQLKNLKVLKMMKTELEEFSLSVCELVTLETLDVRGNNIITVPPQITQLKNLKELYLGLNELEEFPLSICELVTLETLDLLGNNITIVPHEIKQLKNLKELYLGQNELEEFSFSVCELVTLEILDLRKNKISKIPPQIEQLQQLKIIFLDNNKLTSLPPEVRLLPELGMFFLANNNLVQPPQKLAERGVDDIQRYFDDLVRTKATSSCRLQVQVIGKTWSGKTSLVKTLTSGTPFLTAMADRTHVMEQIRWSPEEDIFLSINDFGGHDIYEVAHNFFITKDALTLIVFNLQDAPLNYQEAVGRWLDNVYSRAPGSAILLVGTHADCLSNEEVKRNIREVSHALSSHLRDMESNFKTRFEELEKKREGKKSGQRAYKEKILQMKRLIKTPPLVDQDVFVISSENGNGIFELKEELIRKAREKKFILPKSWLQKVEQIEKAQRNKQDPYLTLASLADMAALTPSQMRRGDDAQRIEDVLSFLHATGAVLWFRDKPLLKTFIFHRQDVFIDILKAVLRHDIDSILVYDIDPFNKKFSKAKFESAKRDVLQRGIISRTMLECLWRRFNFEKQGFYAMIQLLEIFEVCYIVKDADDDKYHFPWLLKDDRPEDVSSSWSIVPTRDEFQISIEIHFPVTCPTGFYEMAAVHLHGHLGQFKASRRDWKDGFYAKLDNQFRMCFEREVRGVIRLSIRGKYTIQLKKYSLRMLQVLLALAEKECPGSPWDEYIVCPHCVHEENNPPTLFDTPVSLLSVPLEAPIPYHPCPEEEPEFMASADFYYPVTSGKMTDLHYTSLEKHLMQVVDDVRGSGQEILPRLVKADVITEKEKTASLVLGEEDRIIAFLRRKNDSAFYIFCGALHDSGHVETVQLLRLPDMAVMLSEAGFKNLLQRLQSKDFLSQPDIDAVMSKPTKSSRVSALVKKLREDKNSQEAGRAFDEFRDALYDETTRLKELY